MYHRSYTLSYIATGQWNIRFFLQMKLYIPLLSWLPCKWVEFVEPMFSKLQQGNLKQKQKSQPRTTSTGPSLSKSNWITTMQPRKLSRCKDEICWFNISLFGRRGDSTFQCKELVLGWILPYLRYWMLVDGIVIKAAPSRWYLVVCRDGFVENNTGPYNQAHSFYFSEGIGWLWL